MPRITVVNDNPEFLEMMDEVLEDGRYASTTIDGDRPDALEAIRESRPDLLIIDVRLGVEGDHGWQIAKQVRGDAAFTDLPVLLCCADPYALAEMGEEISATRKVETLTKPFSVDELTDAVARLLGEPAVKQA